MFAPDSVDQLQSPTNDQSTNVMAEYQKGASKLEHPHQTNALRLTAPTSHANIGPSRSDDISLRTGV
jgi:hypothetical protein